MIIKIAIDFSKTPGVRYEQEGDHPGSDFRERILLPKLQEAISKGDKLTIDLDGTSGLGTSFLEESFGGLIRVNKIRYNDIMNTLVFIATEDPDYIDEIQEYLQDARDNEE